MSVDADPAKDPLFTAAIDLIGHTGATNFQLRFQDDEQPVVWVAVAGYQRNGAEVFEAAGALSPARATLRLCAQLMDGGTCTHCHRPSGINEDFSNEMPLDILVCWYVFDPELSKFRRSCEGTDTRPCRTCDQPEVIHLGKGPLALDHPYLPSRRIR